MSAAPITSAPSVPDSGVGEGLAAITRPSLDVRQERFVLQGQFLTPVFDLFKDLSALSRHLFDALGPHYNLRLSDMRFESGTGSLGEVFLRLAWPALAEVRIFLDRVEIESSYLSFLRFENRDFVADVLSAVAAYVQAVAVYVQETRFRAYSVTQEIHGELVGQSRQEFLAQFAPSVPVGLGPVLGAGIIFYFGEEEDRLAASVTLDFSRAVGGGIFVQSVVLYDASRVPASDLQAVARSQFKSLFDRIGLAGR
jgi:hypothetical protein